MTEVKRIDIAEFQRLGFLQEANRQFFHPLGLALELTRIDDPEENPRAKGTPPFYRLILDAEEYDRLKRLGDEILADGQRAPELVDEIDQALWRTVAAAERLDVGDAYLSGVWDYREDPEGMVYGDLPAHPDAAEKARAVDLERLRHRPARLRLFDAEYADAGALEPDPPDVQPLDWTLTPAGE